MAVQGGRRALFSVECHEGNYAVENLLRGARADEVGRDLSPAPLN
jgi:hypothetical protein